MATIHLVAVQRAQARTGRRRYWQRWTADLATHRYEAEPYRPELYAYMAEYTVRGRDALGAVWADLSDALDPRVVACVVGLACLLVAGRGL